MKKLLLAVALTLSFSAHAAHTSKMDCEAAGMVAAKQTACFTVKMQGEALHQRKANEALEWMDRTTKELDMQLKCSKERLASPINMAGPDCVRLGYR